MTNFEEQYYRHQGQLPKTHVHLDSKEDFLSISLSWGEIDPTETLNAALMSYYFASKNDLEVTSPFEILTCLSPLANRLRTSMLIGNSAIYNKYNSKSLAAGVEYLCVARSDRELAIAQIGGPSVVLVRDNQPHVLSASPLLCLNAETPLPAQLMGIENSCFPLIQTIRYEPRDLLYFVSSVSVPEGLFNQNLNNAPLKNVVENIAKANFKRPFWLGRIKL